MKTSLVMALDGKMSLWVEIKITLSDNNYNWCHIMTKKIHASAGYHDFNSEATMLLYHPGGNQA